MPRVQRPEASIHYEVSGDGPPLVFAHGAGGNTLVWWQQVPHFARRYRVVTFDHRGFGRSACTSGHEQGRHFADDLAAVLDDAGIARCALVCQSMGGWTGLQFALAQPQRVAALVLSGTPAGILTPAVGAALGAIASSSAAACSSRRRGISRTRRWPPTSSTATRRAPSSTDSSPASTRPGASAASRSTR